MSRPFTHPKDNPPVSLPATELPLELRETLQTDPSFANLATWRFQPVTGGNISPHTYRLRAPGRDFFVKTVTPNEKYTLQLLHQARVSLAPAIYSVRLLELGCLVTDFIPGGRLKTKRLQPALIRAMAEMQNALNDEALFESSRTPSGCKYTDHDDGFYHQSLLKNFIAGQQLLRALAAQYNLPILDQYQRLADSLAVHLAALVDAYAGMPFAWLHNDFREDNLLGDPLRLVDWGSSYGHGPFLVDLAPFLVDDPDGLRLFVGESEIAKTAGESELARWLRAALGARFVEFLRWRLDLDDGHLDSPEACRAFLAYEFTPFQSLLDYEF